VAPSAGLDFEAATSHVITVRAQSEDGSTTTRQFTVEVSDVAEPVTVSLTDVISTLPENTVTPDRVAMIQLGGPSSVVSLAGPDAQYFEIVGSALRLKPGLLLDFEAKSSYSAVIEVDNLSTGTGVDGSATYSLNIADLNEPPRSLHFDFLVTTLPEGTATPLPVATAVLVDDALVTTILTLAGADADAFEMVGNTLQLKASTQLDFETKGFYEVVLFVDDPAIGTSWDLLTSYQLTVTDIDEFDVDPISDDDVAFNSAVEDSPVGTSVGIAAFTSDLDGTKTGITYSPANARGGRFLSGSDLERNQVQSRPDRIDPQLLRPSSRGRVLRRLRNRASLFESVAANDPSIRGESTVQEEVS
jgi:hypothetical protein